MLKKLLASLLLVAMAANPVSAQLNLTYTSFQPGQSISAAQFTANFTAISANALNRTGGTMTGTFTANAAVDINSTFTIGSGNVQPFDSTGKIQALNSTYFANIDASLGSVTVTGLTCTGCIGATQLASTAVGANTYGNGTSAIVGAFTVDADGRLTSVTQANVSSLTGIVETAITEGTLLARVGDDEVLTGDWTAPSFTISQSTAARLYLVDQAAALNAKRWEVTSSGGNFTIIAVNDAISSSTPAFTLTRSGTTPTGATISANAINLTGVTLGVTASTSTTFTTPQANFSGTLGVTGNTSITGTSLLNGAVTANSSIAVGTNLSVAGNASVTGTLTTGTFSPTSLTMAATSSTITLTGAIPVMTIGGNTAEGSINIMSNSGGTFSTIEVDYNNGITLTTTVDSIFLNSAADIEVGNDLVPVTHNFYDLGTTSLRYRDAWVQRASFNGSDRRLKHDITPIREGLEFVLALKPVNYRWISGKQTLQYGFIAQDLLELGFEGVDTSNPKEYALNYVSLIAPTVKAVQELHEEVHKLEMQNKILQAEIIGLVNRVRDLEKGVGRQAN